MAVASVFLCVSSDTDIPAFSVGLYTLQYIILIPLPPSPSSARPLIVIVRFFPYVSSLYLPPTFLSASVSVVPSPHALRSSSTSLSSVPILKYRSFSLESTSCFPYGNPLSNSSLSSFVSSFPALSYAFIVTMASAVITYTPFAFNPALAAVPNELSVKLMSTS